MVTEMTKLDGSTSVLLSSHSFEEVEALSDNITMLNNYSPLTSKLNEVSTLTRQQVVELEVKLSQPDEMIVDKLIAMVPPEFDEVYIFDIPTIVEHIKLPHL